MKSTFLILLSTLAMVANANEYEVTITNLTAHQTLSPPLLAVHSPAMGLFSVGHPASVGVAKVAEDGDRSTLRTELEKSGKVESIVEAMGGIKPGQSAKFRVKAEAADAVLSVITMLVTTNDGFTGVSSLAFPMSSFQTGTNAYDAGSEANTESCMHIPGPPCGAHNARTAMGEGTVQMHPGIMGMGDLDARKFNWMNPVARLTVVRL